MRPLLFLDVDGPLIPFDGESQLYANPESGGNPLLARINPQHGPRLTALDCELVWATTWMNEANECIAPRLGLSQLAVVEWPESAEFEEQDERAGLHWKTRALVDWAAGRAFLWVDDEITDADRAWVSAHHPGPAPLHRVDPRLGLADADYAALGEWPRP
ncbi:HAD domain-containing protein [Crossiella sp. CA198]|uniref:HAD domain-containing protein n=1 Tax=Crossiella sp. CA198 TaxID=3455607 RepID=UPI003F8D4F32